MINKIDKNYYCELQRCGEHFVPFNTTLYCPLTYYRKTCEQHQNSLAKGCFMKHRKYPTPEQFKKEYGFDWEGAVYWLNRNNKNYKWEVADNISDVGSEEEIYYYCVICACTPWGKPPADWRP